MAGSSGTSSLESEANQRIQLCEGDEDLISALPDCLIHHILSFLPSTRDSIRTSLLSKRWLLQWSHVPVLILDPNVGMSSESFSNFIDKALSVHNCPKIEKFAIDSKGFCLDKLGCKFDAWIHFAVARDVQELMFDCDAIDLYVSCESYRLPECLLGSASLVKFRAHCFAFMPDANVSWVSLKALRLGFCNLPNNAVENVLAGCPVIEYLELMVCDGFEELAVVSKSLKMLRIRALRTCYAIEICCPNMEKLELLGQMVCLSVKLKDLPLSVSATLDFAIELDGKTEVELFEFVKDILLQVQHVNELILGPWILMILSLGAERGEPCLSLNSKCLTVIDLYLERRVPGLVYLLLCCPMIEKLSMQLFGALSSQYDGSVKVEKKFWESNESLFSCLMSSLKTVEIKCLIFAGVDQDELLEFARFILENARVLERMVFLEPLPGLMVSANKVCQKLSGVRKSSPHAVVEVARLPWGILHPSLNIGKELLMEMMK